MDKKVLLQIGKELSREELIKRILKRVDYFVNRECIAKHEEYLEKLAERQAEFDSLKYIW